MVKREEFVKITIDGDDFRVLSDICELTRRYMSKARNCQMHGPIDEYDAKQTQEIQELMDKIWGN